MFNKILVPLDGSVLAERALPRVLDLARQGLVNKVILLNVVKLKLRLTDIPLNELGIGMGMDTAPQWHEELGRNRDYLTSMEFQLRSQGLKVESVLLEGRHPARDIAKFAQESDIDLILVASHGYTGLKRMLFGSVAAKVIQKARVPVFLIREATAVSENVEYHTFMGKPASHAA